MQRWYKSLPLLLVAIVLRWYTIFASAFLWHAEMVQILNSAFSGNSTKMVHNICLCLSGNSTKMVHSLCFCVLLSCILEWYTICTAASNGILRCTQSLSLLLLRWCKQSLLLPFVMIHKFCICFLWHTETVNNCFLFCHILR